MKTKDLLMISGFIGQLAPYQTRIKAIVYKKIAKEPNLESFKEANQIQSKALKEEDLGKVINPNALYNT